MSISCCLISKSVIATCSLSVTAVHSHCVHCDMAFSLSGLNGLEDKIQKLSESVSEKVKCGNSEKLNHDSIKLKNLIKESLAEMVVNMGSVISDCRTILRSGSPQASLSLHEERRISAVNYKPW